MRLTKPFFTAACLLFASIQMAAPALADDAGMISAMPEIATSEIASSEIASSEIASSEIASSEIASSEIASSEKATSEKATSEIASSEKATSEIASSEIASSEIATAEMATPEVLAFGEQVTDADLSTYRGGSALQYTEMKLDGRLYDNQAIANVTGSNFVTQDAFSGASGFSTVVQNSGNNVIIQNATILNISLH